MSNNWSFMAKASELARKYGYGISFKISEYDDDNFVICVFNDDVRGWCTVDLCASEYTILKAVEHLAVGTDRIWKERPYTKWGDKVMTGNEYQKLAMRTNDREATKRLLESMLTCDMKYLLSQNLVFEDEQHLDLGGIFNACLGLSGEVGEFNDMIKKWVFHEKELDMEHAKKEMGDVLWYVAMMCESFGWDVDEIMQMNVDKLKARYPEGFDVERANHRAKGDV